MELMEDTCACLTAGAANRFAGGCHRSAQSTQLNRASRGFESVTTAVEHRENRGVWDAG